MGWNVKFFETARGTSPVKDFFDEQDLTTQTKINHLVRLLINYGPFLKPPYSKKIQDKLYELRVSGKLAIRIFYTKISNEYCLLHAFKKKAQKTPRKEIKTALDRAEEII